MLIKNINYCSLKNNQLLIQMNKLDFNPFINKLVNFNLIYLFSVYFVLKNNIFNLNTLKLYIHGARL